MNAQLRDRLLAESNRMKAKSGMASYALPDSTRELLREAAAALAAPSKEAGPSDYQPIVRDATFDRDYIPMPGGWEIQTKGNGSTFRIAGPEEDDRLPIGSQPYLHETLTKMARAVNAAWKAANPPGDQRQKKD